MSRPTLRTIVVLMAGLAALKVWAQDRYHRAIYHDALVEAYEDKARAACGKEMTRLNRTLAGLALHVDAVSIGSPDVRVALWDVDNPLWDVRYRNPHLMMSAKLSNDVRCAFDVTAGLVTLAGTPAGSASYAISDARR